MIEYQRDQQQTIPDSQVKIVGVGGAGLNMMDRVALDGLQGVELLALASDARTLNSSIAQEKVQLGAKLTMGLGCGGDPELGLRAAQEQETEIRDALRDRTMVFICAGLGGGTGSGGAPLVARIAREMGAFVVVFATMPFEFEGKRRREQAESALNELSVIANALVTFENSRMGELVLAAQGIHEAFAAGDRMISESIQAVTRLVVCPGLVNIGLDDLVSALRTTRSRCLFGSGMASGENRSHAALQNALTSPLLEKGRLLKDAKTVLVHVCGGESVTLYEIELLMRELSKQVAEDAHILFGTAVDQSMGDSLSVTIISSLPESHFSETVAPVVTGFDDEKPEPAPELLIVELDEIEEPEELEEELVDSIKIEEFEEDVEDMTPQAADPVADLFEEKAEDEAQSLKEEEADFDAPAAKEEVLFDVDDAALVVEEPAESPVKEIPKEESQYDFKEPAAKEDKASDVQDLLDEIDAAVESEQSDDMSVFKAMEEELVDDAIKEAIKQKASAKAGQAELELDGGPRGKFEGEAPNLVDGEDLDIPPYLRNKK